MRKLAYFSLFLVVLFSCNPKFTQFYVDYSSTAVIPATVPLNTPFTIYTPEQTTNSAYSFSIHDTRKDKVEEIKLKELQLKITSPNNKTFSFLSKIEVYISTPQLNEKRIAYKNNIPDNASISCEVEDLDIKEYIKSDTFKIRLKTTTDEVISEDIEVEIYSNYFVDAELI